jgi:hypothetical protein
VSGAKTLQFVMLNAAKHPHWIDLTLSAGADVPLLLQGEEQEGEVCHPPVMLNEEQRSEASMLDSSRRAE